jgi:hypothetical protein
MEREALAITREQEATALQLGAGWHLEAMLITYSSLAYALCRDMLGLKRCVEDLTRLVDAGFAFRPQLAWATGEYHRERGELVEAQRRLDEALELLDEEENTIRQWSMAALAEVALARGDHGEARRLAEEGLSFSSRPDVGQVLPRLKVTRALALAEAGLGEIDEAVARLSAAISEAETLGNPPLLAVLHEASARIAFAREDRLLYERHRLELVSAVERTRNPALIAIAERVKALDRPDAKDSEEGERVLEGAAVTIATAVEGAASKLAQCRGPAERAARVLELALGSSTGRSGYLFVLADGALALAAPAHTRVPTEVEDAVSAAVELTVEDDSGATVDVHESESPVSKIYEVCPLSFTESGAVHVVGALAIVPGSLAYSPPNPRLLEELARELHRAGDVSTAAPTERD